MTALQAWIEQHSEQGFLFAVAAAVFVFAVGVLLSRLASFVVRRVFGPHTSPQHLMVLQRFVSWTILGLAGASALHQVGIDITVLLGAAGVLTVAIGFASQTSASNLISGLFLLVERPFVIGDVIEVDGRTGEVVSIDWLSVKLRTFDNVLVRVPNESLLKTSLRNLTYFPIRRYDLQLSVGYDTDLEQLREVLERVAQDHPHVLDEPKAQVMFQRFGESAIDVQLSAWATQDRYLEVRNTLPVRVKRAFDAAGIEIPYPQRVVRHLAAPPTSG